MFIESPTFRQLISERHFSAFYDTGLTSRFNARRLTHSLTYSQQSDNPSVRLDLENEKYLYRLTLWEDGSCYIEALSVSSGKSMFNQHYQFSSTDEFFESYPSTINSLFPLARE